MAGACQPPESRMEGRDMAFFWQARALRSRHHVHRACASCIRRTRSGIWHPAWMCVSHATDPQPGVCSGTGRGAVKSGHVGKFSPRESNCNTPDTPHKIPLWTRRCSTRLFLSPPSPVSLSPRTSPQSVEWSLSRCMRARRQQRFLSLSLLSALQQSPTDHLALSPWTRSPIIVESQASPHVVSGGRHALLCCGRLPR